MTRSVPAGGTLLDIEELRGTAGSTVTLLGGVHGDEPEGMLAVRRVVAALRTGGLRGTLRALAVANPLAHAADARCTPADGGNLARAFGADDAAPSDAAPGDVAPGDAATRDAGPTAAIAAAIERELIDGADLVIDLHSAGRAGAMPLFCGFLAGGDPAVAARAETAARAFGAPLTWAHDELGPGRTLSAARDRGIPAIYVEAGGGGEVRGAELDALVGGTLAVLGLLLPPPGMTAGLGPVEGPDPALVPNERRIVRGGDGDLDRSPSAPAAGTLVTRTAAGADVRAGDPLAELFDDDGEPIATIAAPCDGIVMYLRRDARVAAGDAVALVAPEPVAW